MVEGTFIIIFLLIRAVVKSIREAIKAYQEIEEDE